MSGRLTRHAFAQMIAEDRAWLIANSPASLEREHIIAVLDQSVEANYGPEAQAQQAQGGEE